MINPGKTTQNKNTPLAALNEIMRQVTRFRKEYVPGTGGGGAGDSTEAKQDDQIVVLNAIDTVLDNIKLDSTNLDVALSTIATEITTEAIRVLLASLDSKDFSTEATLANFNSYMQAAMPTISTESKQDDVIAELQTLVVNTNDSFNSTQHTISSGGGTITGAGNVPAGFKTVVIKRQSGTIVVNGGLTLDNAFRAITFNATESDRVDTTLPAINITGTGTWQWIALDNVEV